ncbi:PKD domain-containing protein [Marinicellulosiphila megalodicopiae]|uniref:PKD domain-containing protein n=1 Tax=Marinicellulosiphila megalodicopiae TaxID=2724896 RepID=UPI003BAEFC15
MNIRSLIVSLGVIIGLTSCGGEVELDTTKSVIQAPSTMVAPADSNGEVSFNLINDISYPSDVSPTYTWFFGDGSDPVTSTIPLMNHDFPENKDYEVRVQITDQNGNAAGKIVTLIVKVTNAVVKDVAFTLPSTLITPTVGAKGLVTIDATNITIPETSSAQYTWDFGDNNTRSTSIGLVQHQYTANGTYTVTLTIKDSNNKAPTISTTYSVIVDNIDESSFSVFIGYSSDAQNPLSLTFNSVSENLVNTPATYSWDFGDNQTSDLENPTNNFAQAGNYNVELTVTDSLGEVKTTQRMIVVSNVPNVAPVAMIGQMDTYFNEITVSAAGSSDEEGASLTYTWDFGDGKVVMGDEVETHTYASVGDFVVTLTVSDGELEHSVTADVTTQEKTRANLIENSIASFINGGVTFTCANCHYSAGPAKDGDLFLKSGAASLVTSASVEDGLVDWLNAGGQNNFTNPVTGGATGEHVIVLKSDTTAGAYKVKMWNDLVDAMVLYVEELNSQENTKPNAVITSAFESGTTYLFNASTSSDPEGKALTYSWDFGDATALNTTVNPSHEFPEGGRYTVVLTVSDGELTDTASVEISTKVKLNGNLAMGETRYAQLCARCHEGDDDEVYGEGTAPVEPIAINRYLNHQADLFEKIDTSMPPLPNSGDCVDQCAADIEAFMMSWERVQKDTSCTLDAESKVNYGPRQMRLLTSIEYVNTVKTLFNYDVDLGLLPADDQIHFFSNHAQTSLNSSRLDAFESIAKKIVAYSAAEGYANVKGFDEGFSDGIARRAFRRPLNSTEVAGYTALEASSYEDALQALLISPNFLFRSELGMTKDEFIDFNENSDPVYIISGTPIDVGFSQEIARYDQPRFSHNFTGNDLVIIKVKGTINTEAHQPNIWPELGIQVPNGNGFLHTETIDKAGYKTVKIVLNGANALNGNTELVVRQAQSPHGNQTLTVDSILIGAAEQVIFEVPDIEDGSYALTPYEMATFLAYTYTGNTPDDTLLEAANEGLATDAAVRAQIERLMATDAAKEHFGTFVDQWLMTDNVLSVAKDADKYPGFTPAVREAMHQEAREIFNDVMFNNTGFSSLYDSNYTFVNNVLAQFYGIGGASGATFNKVSDATRGGILTSGAFLSSLATPEESHLIKRAVRIRERVMCQHLPPFPTDVNLDTIREIQAQKVEDKKAENNGEIRQPHLDYINTDVDACKGCHEYIINPLGVALEDYDAVGLPRTTYRNGLTVDFTGFDSSIEQHNAHLYGINDLYETTDGIALSGVKSLGQILAGEEVTRDCLQEMAFRFVMDTGPDKFDHADEDKIVLAEDELVNYACAISSMDTAMQAEDNPKEAFINLGLSEIVRFRKEYNR